MKIAKKFSLTSILVAIVLLSLGAFSALKFLHSNGQVFSGVLYVDHVHYEDKNESKTTYVIKTKSGEELQLKFEDPMVAISEPTVLTGTHVSVQGRRENNIIVVPAVRHYENGVPNYIKVAAAKIQTAASVSVLEPDIPNTQVIGTHQMAFIMATYNSDPRTPTNIDVIRTLRQQIHDFFYEQSYGKLNMVSTDADVYGTYHIDKLSPCNVRTYKDNIAQQASAAGVNLSKYQHIVYVVPLDTSCPVGSGTDIGANWVIVNGNRYMAVRVVSHELGHNLGLDHASGVRCRAYNTSLQNPLGGLTDCDWEEYNDPYDVMDGYYDLY
jgi:hypothetical protein